MFQEQGTGCKLNSVGSPVRKRPTRCRKLTQSTSLNPEPLLNKRHATGQYIAIRVEPVKIDAAGEAGCIKADGVIAG